VNSHGEGFSQFSIINGADTWRGGTHIEVLKEFYVNKIREVLRKKHKLEPTYNDVAKYLRFVVIGHIKAPQFDGQTKEKLSNDRKELEKAFGNIFPTRIPKSIEGIIKESVEAVSLKNDAKEMSDLRKEQKKLKAKKIPKLIDCSTRDRMKATLYITEGDSAVGGISSVRDPKFQAGLPLKGKILNVSEMSPKTIIKNQEIQTLMSTIGLEIGKSPVKFVNNKVAPTTLRYGNISILTDADHDGAAIRCLLINFLYKFWPELFRHNIVTISEAPLYEVYNSSTKKTEYFYEKQDCDSYLKGKTTKCKVSYFKGLGSCDEGAWEYFINKSPRMYSVSLDDETDNNLNMAFSKNADNRKEWLR
jgi:DNA gyrase/topoisomerase IV subunit B